MKLRLEIPPQLLEFVGRDQVRFGVDDQIQCLEYYRHELEVRTWLPKFCRFDAIYFCSLILVLKSDEYLRHCLWPLGFARINIYIIYSAISSLSRFLTILAPNYIVFVCPLTAGQWEDRRNRFSGWFWTPTYSGISGFYVSHFDITVTVHFWIKRYGNILYRDFSALLNYSTRIRFNHYP